MDEIEPFMMISGKETLQILKGEKYWLHFGTPHNQPSMHYVAVRSFTIICQLERLRAEQIENTIAKGKNCNDGKKETW